MLEITSPDILRASARFSADGRPTSRDDHALRQFRLAQRAAAETGAHTPARAPLSRFIARLGVFYRGKPHRVWPTVTRHLQ